MNPSFRLASPRHRFKQRQPGAWATWPPSALWVLLCTAEAARHRKASQNCETKALSCVHVPLGQNCTSSSVVKIFTQSNQGNIAHSSQRDERDQAFSALALVTWDHAHCGGRPVHCRVFSSNPRLYPPEAVIFLPSG